MEIGTLTLPHTAPANLPKPPVAIPQDMCYLVGYSALGCGEIFRTPSPTRFVAQPLAVRRRRGPLRIGAHSLERHVEPEA